MTDRLDCRDKALLGRWRSSAAIEMPRTRTPPLMAAATPEGSGVGHDSAAPHGAIDGGVLWVLMDPVATSPWQALAFSFSFTAGVISSGLILRSNRPGAARSSLGDQPTGSTDHARSAS
jgi:hypothetical protein